MPVRAFLKAIDKHCDAAGGTKVSRGGMYSCGGPAAMSTARYRPGHALGPVKSAVPIGYKT
jgi:hypothetical protein